MRWLIFLSFLIRFDVGICTDPWSFIVLADWHGGETFAKIPGTESEAWQKHLETIRYIQQTAGGDLIIFPGDTQNGKWDTEEFINSFDPSLEPEESVLAAGQNCYRTIRNLFEEGGYPKILMAIGDHELGGNGWSPSSSKVRSLPQFRQGFIDEFNRDMEGNFRFQESIGNATARPLGTKFKETSFAHRHKNALFITIDAFHVVGQGEGVFLDRKNGHGGEGIITCTVQGKHLAWLEEVLSEAQINPRINHIFVQAHVPILQPVRKVACSGQFMDSAENSNFWKLMAKYEVDLYFAGEVHATTAIKDDESNLIQIVSRGNMFNNFLKVTVIDDSIQIESYNEIGTESRWNNNYLLHGQLFVDKSSSDTNIQSSGVLELLDQMDPIVHLDFEKIVPLKERQILGMVHDDLGEKLVGDTITMRGTKCTDAIPNQGSFGQQYDAQIAHAKLVSGIQGNYAVSLNQDSRLSLFSTGPHSGGNIISYALWFKTESDFNNRNMILLHYGKIHGSDAKSSKDIFSVALENGKPVIYTSPNISLMPMDNVRLDDGQWHHIAVSMPKQSCLLSEVKIWINGISIKTKVKGEDEHLFLHTGGRLSLGGFGYSAPSYEDHFPHLKPFIGLMDNFLMWGRPIKKSPDLQVATEKNFEKFKKTKCKGEKMNVFRSNRSTCRKSCKFEPRCWGYEFRKTMNGRKCSHFSHRPEPQKGENRRFQCFRVV